MTTDEQETMNRKLDDLLARTLALEAKVCALQERVDATNAGVIRLVPGVVGGGQ